VRAPLAVRCRSLGHGEGGVRAALAVVRVGDRAGAITRPAGKGFNAARRDDSVTRSRYTPS